MQLMGHTDLKTNLSSQKSCFTPEWSSDGHVHLSLQNLLVGKYLLILSLAYHMIIGHLL